MHSLLHSCSLNHSFIRSFIHSFIHSIIFSCTYSSHSLSSLINLPYKQITAAKTHRNPRHPSCRTAAQRHKPPKGHMPTDEPKGPPGCSALSSSRTPWTASPQPQARPPPAPHQSPPTRMTSCSCLGEKKMQAYITLAYS